MSDHQVSGLIFLIVIFLIGGLWMLVLILKRKPLLKKSCANGVKITRFAMMMRMQRKSGNMAILATELQ
ncbi:MAG: hypothetical protein ABS45_07575 [Comamonas sp. SCN 65-56]|nr:MAG: hypothetical protein ABS45_07575 [Comamonas sp. SCN 65-56]